MLCLGENQQRASDMSKALPQSFKDIFFYLLFDWCKFKGSITCVSYYYYNFTDIIFYYVKSVTLYVGSRYCRVL